ncbi:MAG: phosphotransacetylase family protein, partial [Moorella sp. (in: Bacteria)]|nr:phosphotransacetylase family protein [Moorella sp. (in: firmicutes)]
AGSGKTAVSLGLALKFQEQGYRVAYFKPIGHPTGAKGQGDEDGLLMQQVLGLPQHLETIVPYTIGSSYLSGNRRTAPLEQITAAYRRVSAGADIVIIGGAGFPYLMGSLGADALTLARHFGAAVLFTVQIKNDYSLDEVIFYNNCFSQTSPRVLGNIFNNVPRPLLAKTEGVYRSLLAERGYRTLGIIPRRAEIACPTVAEYYEVLGGEILAGEEGLFRIVED